MLSLSPPTVAVMEKVTKNEQINRNAYFAKEEERIALLERYKKLYAEGIISEAEFASKKNSIANISKNSHFIF